MANVLRFDLLNNGKFLFALFDARRFLKRLTSTRFPKQYPVAFAHINEVTGHLQLRPLVSVFLLLI